MRRGIISINIELKRKLEMLRGERTWDELLNTTIKAKGSRKLSERNC
ncbi:hypothetical protein [Candidatus Methanodesulfokora washburnensis]|jgi:hypothetical protein|nr:hypothetical protein [Candidatus Methanodesulfokores washburnensis]